MASSGHAFTKELDDLDFADYISAYYHIHTQTNAKEVQQIDAGSGKVRLENKHTEHKTTKGEQYTTS